MEPVSIALSICSLFLGIIGAYSGVKAIIKDLTARRNRNKDEFDDSEDEDQ